MKTRRIITRDLPVLMPPNRCTPAKCFQKIRLKRNCSTTVVPTKKIPKQKRNVLKGIDHFYSSTNKFSENPVGKLILNHDFYSRPNWKGTSEKVVPFSWFEMFRTEVHVQVHFFRAIFDSSFRFNIRSEFLVNETDFCKW